MPKLVYLLWSHAEHGPEELIATLDRTSLVRLALQSGFEESDTSIVGLVDALKSTDEQLSMKFEGITQLGRGWGGLHLQVVELR